MHSFFTAEAQVQTAGSPVGYRGLEQGRAGATATAEVADEHGWRLGRIIDPFGHEWEIGTPVGPWPPG